MKLPSLIISIALLFSTFCFSQEPTLPAKELLTQANKELKQADYAKARSTYHQAYAAFVAQEDYKNTVTCAVALSALYHRENRYQEAFDMCRAAEYVLLTGEQKQQKKFYDLRYPIVKQRLQLYLKLKNAQQSSNQLSNLQELARQAGSATLNEDLLCTKVTYHYNFGQYKEGDASFNELIAQYQSQKEYEKVDTCYQLLIAQAREANQVVLMDRIYKRFITWSDSIDALRTQSELSKYEHDRSESEQIIRQKDKELAIKQNLILVLYFVIAALLIALCALTLLMLRYKALVNRQKQSIRDAQAYNEQKSQFMGNLSEQMSPTINALGTSISELPNAQEAQSLVKALNVFNKHIEELSVLENSLTEGYKIVNINNINTFCEAVISKIKPMVKPEVELTSTVMKLQVKSNPEQLERILTHLLTNATQYTSTGRIVLDFKKRGASTYQFIVTDTGTGIAVSEQKDLFKPFSSRKMLTKGDGLGLPICALIATKMNGTLTLDTEYKKGARFILELRS